jgi:hypothetical protein
MKYKARGNAAGALESDFNARSFVSSFETLRRSSFMMRKAIAGFVLLLAGCGQPNYILVMTTFAANANSVAVGTQTAIQGFRSKEACQFAGDQWHSSLGTDTSNKFVCLEPKP